MRDVPEINTPAFQADLHANLRRLRETEPVHAHAYHGEPRYSLLRYDDCVDAFRDERLGAVRIRADWLEKLAGSGHRDLTSLGRVLGHILIIQDAPDHTRLRGLVSRAFTPRTVERLTARVESLVGERMAPWRDAARVDLIADFAVPLPVVVIAELLGVPAEDRDRLKRWSASFSPMLDRDLNRLETGLLDAAAACTAFADFFGPLFEERRREPRDDLISRLVAVADDGDGALSEDELLATCVLLLVAGHETTTNLIGNGVWTLLRHPEQLSWLHRHPEGIESAVEELLRYEGPLQRAVRHTKAPVELRGVRIPADNLVDLVLASADRDPERFPEPDRLDLARPDNRHLAFGLGAHFCLGAALARLEGRVALRALVERFPAMKLAAERVEWRPGSVFRALRALPVAL